MYAIEVVNALHARAVILRPKLWFAKRSHFIASIVRVFEAFNKSRVMLFGHKECQLTKSGDSASLRRLFAFLKVNERYGDVSPIVSGSSNPAEGECAQKRCKT